MLKVSQLITALQQLLNKHGDLTVVHGLELDGFGNGITCVEVQDGIDLNTNLPQKYAEILISEPICESTDIN